MKIQNCHLNFKPTKKDTTTTDNNNNNNNNNNNIVKERIDKWHFDTTSFVLVVFCTDPTTYEEI